MRKKARNIVADTAPYLGRFIWDAASGTLYLGRFIWDAFVVIHLHDSRPSIVVRYAGETNSIKHDEKIRSFAAIARHPGSGDSVGPSAQLSPVPLGIGFNNPARS